MVYSTHRSPVRFAEERSEDAGSSSPLIVSMVMVISVAVATAEAVRMRGTTWNEDAEVGLTDHVPKMEISLAPTTESMVRICPSPTPPVISTAYPVKFAAV